MTKTTPKKTIPEPEDMVVIDAEVAHTFQAPAQEPAQAPAQAPAQEPAQAPATQAPAQATDAMDYLFFFSILHCQPNNRIVPKFRGLLMSDLTAKTFAIILQVGLPGVLTYMFAPLLMMFPLTLRVIAELLLNPLAFWCVMEFKYYTGLASCVELESLLVLVSTWRACGLRNLFEFAVGTGVGLAFVFFNILIREHVQKYTHARFPKSDERLVQTVKDVEVLKEEILAAHNRFERVKRELIPFGLAVVVLYAVSSVISTYYENICHLQRGLAFVLITLVLAVAGAAFATYIAFDHSVKRVTQPAFSFHIEADTCLISCFSIITIYSVLLLLFKPGEVPYSILPGLGPLLNWIYWRFCDFTLLTVVTLGFLCLSAVDEAVIRGDGIELSPFSAGQSLQSSETSPSQTRQA